MNIKYNININQLAILENGLMENIDIKDACLLDYIICFSKSNKIEKIVFEGDTYFWFGYNHILNQLPILKLKDTDYISRKFRGFVKLGLLKAHPNNQKLNKAFFAITQLLENATHNPEAKSEKARKRTTNFKAEKEPKNLNTSGKKTGGSTDFTPKGYGVETVGGTDKKPDNNTIKDNTINNKKEKKPIELDGRSILISQFRAKALTLEIKKGYSIFEWLDLVRFPSFKYYNKKWFHEWLIYFVNGCMERDYDPLSFSTEAYRDSLERFILPKAQAIASKNRKPVY